MKRTASNINLWFGSALFTVLGLCGQVMATQTPSAEPVGKPELVAIEPLDHQDIVNQQSRIFLHQNNFSRAGKKYSELGAINPNATIVADKMHKVQFLLDTTKADGTQANLLRIDIDGDGNFTGDPTTSIGLGQTNKHIARNRLDIQVGSLSGQVTVKGRYLDYRERSADYRYLEIGLYSQIRQKFKIDEKEYDIAITDRDSNLEYGNFTMPVEFSHGTQQVNFRNDTVSIYEANSTGKTAITPIAENICGIPLKIGENFWLFHYDAESNSIIAKLSDKKMLPVTVTTAGAKIMFNLNAQKAVCTSDSTTYLPEGTYTRNIYRIKQQGWTLMPTGLINSEPISITSDKNIISVALPLKPEIEVFHKTQNSYELKPVFKDVHSQDIYLVKNNQAVPVSFRIIDGKGNIVHSGKFEYG